jgi:hypothetical protein
MKSENEKGSDAGGPDAGTGAHTTGALERLRKLDWSLVGTILAIKGLILLFGAQSYQLTTNRRIGSWYGWLEIWNRWDAPHYLEVAQYGYRMTGDSKYRLVLFPLYPWLTRLFALFTGDYLLGAFVVSTVAAVAAGLLLKRLVMLDYSETAARRAVLFLFIFPTSYFLHIGYTEILFLSLALGCFLAARTDRWMLAGVLGALASLSRINGLILIPALAVEAFLQYRATRRWRWSWLWATFAALGFGCYLLINYHVGGNPMLFMKLAREHWGKSLAWPWHGIEGILNTALGPTPVADALMVGAYEFLFVVFGLACTVWCWLRLRPSYGVWMAFNWLLFTSVGFVLCVPRFTLVMFPIYILLARATESRPALRAAATVWSLLFLALFATRFVQGMWAF